MITEYHKPNVVHYEADEIQEMMGPVCTQYSCNCGLDVPPSVEISQTVQVLVQIPEDVCDEFDSVFIFADPSSVQAGNAQGGAILNNWTFLLSEGTPANGGGLIFDLGPAGLLGGPGEYCFEVVLFAGGGQGAGGGVGNGRPLPGDSVSCGTDCTIVLDEED